MTSRAAGRPIRRRVVVVAASTFAVGAVAAVAPTPAVVSASAATSTAISTAGQVAAAGAVSVVRTPVAAPAVRVAPTVVKPATKAVIKATTRTATRTVTRAKAVTATRLTVTAANPYSFGTAGYAQWWAKHLLVTRYRWATTTQFGCLVTLWNRESHWNYRAYNHVSGAQGIPQALPGTKMASAGSDWRTNPVTQVVWGLGYIDGRYGTACGALSHFNGYGWY